MDDIDIMNQQLLEHLSPNGLNSTDFDVLIIRAINVASIQLDYANHQVGEVVRELKKFPPDMASKAGLNRFIAGEIMRDAQMVKFIKLRKELSRRKMYAARIGLGLDRLVSMYQANG